jgi:hypothetical protein
MKRPSTPPSISPTALYQSEEVCTIFGWSYQTLRRRTAPNGPLACCQDGRWTVYLGQQLLDYLAARTIKPQTQGFHQ